MSSSSASEVDTVTDSFSVWGPLRESTYLAQHGPDFELGEDPEDLLDRIAAPHWKSFAEILTALPDGFERVEPAVLAASTEQLADELERWLKTLGFKIRDHPQGLEFRITDWSLYL
jgi:putative heme iron utilization protein